jgi:hypothetical protein
MQLFEEFLKVISLIARRFIASFSIQRHVDERIISIVQASKEANRFGNHKGIERNNCVIAQDDLTVSREIN